MTEWLTLLLRGKVYSQENCQQCVLILMTGFQACRLSEDGGLELIVSSQGI